MGFPCVKQDNRRPSPNSTYHRSILRLLPEYQRYEGHPRLLRYQVPSPEYSQQENVENILELAGSARRGIRTWSTVCRWSRLQLLSCSFSLRLQQSLANIYARYYVVVEEQYFEFTSTKVELEDKHIVETFVEDFHCHDEKQTFMTGTI